MKILRLTQRLPPFPGGLEVHARELSLAQAASGAQVEIRFAEGDLVQSSGVTSFAVEPVGERHAVTRRWPAQQRYSWAVARTGKCGFGVPDVVHAHGDYAIAAAAVHLGNRFGRPAVLTVHGGLSERSWHRAVSAGIFPRLSHIVAVSEDIAGQLQARGVQRDRISVVSSGIHRSRFYPRTEGERSAVRVRYGVSESQTLAVAVGRLHAVKGYRYLIEAARALEAEGAPVRVVLVGTGPDEAALRAAAPGLHTVTFAGHLTASEVAELLGAADLFVHPAVELGTQREGTPTSVLEAMATGLPIIATATGGLPALIRDGVNGRLVRAKETASLIDAIRALASDTALRKMQGELNRLHAACRDWSDVSNKLLELYASLASPEGMPATSVPSEAAW